MIWDRLAPFYDFFEKLYNGKVYKGIAREIENHVYETDVVLECACGTGLLSLPMAKKCKHLTATDYSTGMLKRTKRKLKKYSNVKIEQVDITALPYDADSFDAVVAANVIHLLDDPAAALNEMTRVCKPGGRLIVPTYINKEKKGAVRAARLLGKTGVDFKRQFDLDSYKRFFADCGIAVSQYIVLEGKMPCCFAIIING